MKRQRDNHALAMLMQAAQGGDTQAYVLLLKEITPRLRQIVRAQHRFLKIEDIEGSCARYIAISACGAGHLRPATPVHALAHGGYPASLGRCGAAVYPANSPRGAG